MKKQRMSGMLFKKLITAAVFSALTIILCPGRIMAEEGGDYRVLLPDGTGYKYIYDSAAEGKMYILYDLDGFRQPSENPGWETLKESLDFVDQKSADGMRLQFDIPETGTGINTLYICGEGETVKHAGYLLPDGSGWNGWYSDETLNTPLKTSYAVEAGSKWEDVSALFPVGAYLKLSSGTDTKAFRVSLSYNRPEGFSEVTENTSVDVRASVTTADTAYTPFFTDIPAPVLNMHIAGPKPSGGGEVDPVGASHEIKVMSGAYALQNGKSIRAAKRGETVNITWEEKPGYSFVKWDLSGAVPASPTAPSTSFVMGDSDVSVSFEEKLTFSEDVIEDKDGLPEDADTETKIKKLWFKKTRLQLVKNGTAVENPATAVAKTGEPPQVYYVTSNADVAAVNKNGVFYPVGRGEAVITAYCGNRKAVCNVTVESFTEDISILDEKEKDVTEETVKMKGGSQAFYTVSFAPYDTTDPRNVTWKSNSRKVTVNNGIVTAKEVTVDTVALITATVKYTDPATRKKKSLSRTFNISVSPVETPKAAGGDKTHTLALKKTSLKLQTEGDNASADLAITVTPRSKTLSIENGDFTVDCSSTNEDILAVGVPSAFTLSGKKGISSVTLTAKKAGTAYVVVTSRSKDSGEKVNIQRCKVTVTVPATKIEAKSGSLIIKEENAKKTLTMRKGSAGTIEAVLSPEYSTDCGKVRISVSGGLTVKNGTIYAKKVTTTKAAVITVKCGRLKDTVEVTITK